MKRSANPVWWCSLAFTLFMLGSMIIPSFFPDRGWGNWTPFVALEKPCGEVKRFDWYAPFDGGAGTTWFLFRAGEDWKQGCIRRCGLKESSPDSSLEKSLRQAGALEKWNDPVDFSGWAVFESSPFLWKEGMQPRREGQVFHHRVSLFLEPEGNHCLLALDRSVAERDDPVPALDIAEGEGTWWGKIREYMPEWFLSAFSLGVAGLCVLAPCMLVWIPVLDRMKNSPDATGTWLKFWYYAGTVAGSLLIFSCSFVLTGRRDSPSPFLLFLPVMALVGMAVMLKVAGVLLNSGKNQVSRGRAGDPIPGVGD